MNTGEKRGDPAVLICVGAERWLREQAVREIRQRCVAEGFEETDYVRFQEPPPEPEAILGLLRTAPFGSPRRLVVVDGIEELTPETLPWLAAYLERPNPSTCAVICADRISAGVVPQTLAQSGRVRVLDCQPLKGRTVEDWILARAGQAGHPMAREAAALLAARTGENLQALALGLENLELFVGPGQGITRKEVQALIPPSVRETAFEILDSAASGQPAGAIESFRQAIAMGHLTMDQFFGAVGWYYRMTWKRRRIPRRKVQEALEELLKADVGSKQGHPEPEWLAERLLLKLAGQPGLLS